MRVPADAMPDAKSDGHLHIIDETQSFVVEMWQAKRGPDGLITAVAVKNDLRGPGVYDGWHGVRAYGGSAIAGLIRRGELTDGIHHALAAAVYPKAHNSSGPNSQPFVWPASWPTAMPRRPIRPRAISTWALSWRFRRPWT